MATTITDVGNAIQVTFNTTDIQNMNKSLTQVALEVDGVILYNEFYPRTALQYSNVSVPSTGSNAALLAAIQTMLSA